MQALDSVKQSGKDLRRDLHESTQENGEDANLAAQRKAKFCHEVQRDEQGIQVRYDARDSLQGKDTKIPLRVSLRGWDFPAVLPFLIEEKERRLDY
jgi:hypothetical protein